MNRALRKKSETALDELARTYDLIRELLAERLDGIDTRTLRKRGYRYAGEMQKQGYRYAGAMRRQVEQRARPRRRRFSWLTVALLGGAACAGYMLYRQRDQFTGQLSQVQARARNGYVKVGGITGAVDKVMHRNGGEPAEAELRERVELAIASGGRLPEGLDISVEGRTVYLRGAVETAALADAAAERAHGVDGVVAVVNLTTTRAPA